VLSKNYNAKFQLSGLQAMAQTGWRLTDVKEA